MKNAESRQLVLASGSPRRRELLERLGLECEVVPAGVDEKVERDERPAAYARRLASDKALCVHAQRPGGLVLAADTVVSVDDRILGKPGNDTDAVAMLRSLSGRSHTVVTAVAVADDHGLVSLVDEAVVTFVDLNEDMIQWYVATGEGVDKAGAYAVQGAGGLLVSALVGSPHTVIGLPVHRLPELFAELGHSFLALLDGRLARGSLRNAHGIPQV